MPYVPGPIVIAAVIAAAALVTACSEFATPAELVRPQIVAVRADPAAVPAGERAALSVLIAGPAGPVEPRAVRWWSRDTASAQIEIDAGGGAWLAAPPALATPDEVELELEVELDDGELLRAVKTVVVGGALGRDNPTIVALRADGIPIAEGEPLVVAAGTTALLDLQPETEIDAAVSWYSTLGTIDLYRRAPTELVAPGQPATGWLLAVVRDYRGGVGWRDAELVVR